MVVGRKRRRRGHAELERATSRSHAPLPASSESYYTPRNPPLTEALIIVQPLPSSVSYEFLGAKYCRVSLLRQRGLKAANSHTLRLVTQKLGSSLVGKNAFGGNNRYLRLKVGYKNILVTKPSRSSSFVSRVSLRNTKEGILNIGRVYAI